ncbi:fibrinogen C domain-containing protein 1-like [Ptychodera flava]|uniref:fibrinogen C domain-containing protein 1-like n=1 Tax=Ptychodera flava TaxID=63121 RepID=UPI003969E2E4
MWFGFILRILFLFMLSQICEIHAELSEPSELQEGSKRLPVDCHDILVLEKRTVSGVYTIQPDDQGTPFKVFCDMDTDHGGWTVFQRRRDGSLDFYRYWNDYKNGFGFPTAEFWLGNDRLYTLTNQRRYELRIDLEDFDNENRFAKYDNFIIGDEFSKYKLTLGEYSGTAGDSLGNHNGQRFSTRDRDHDAVSYNCAVTFTGAWWYKSCHESNLNGQYLGGVTGAYGTGVVWFHWRGIYYSFKVSEMKIRPIMLEVESEK